MGVNQAEIVSEYYKLLVFAKTLGVILSCDCESFEVQRASFKEVFNSLEEINTFLIGVSIEQKAMGKSLA